MDGCATFEGCQPFFEVKIPSGTDIKAFSPKLLVRLSISADGKVDDVAVTKSSGSRDVDQQVARGLKKWHFKAEKTRRELSMAILVHLRQ